MGNSIHRLYLHGRTGAAAPTDKKKEQRQQQQGWQGRRVMRLVRAKAPAQHYAQQQHAGKSRACFYAALLSVFFCACMLVQYSLLAPAIAATGIQQQMQIQQHAPQLFAVPAPLRDTASRCAQ